MMAASTPGKPYIERAVNKNWPTITFFDMNGKCSALHFMLEHAGQNYNEDFVSFKTWAERKKDFQGNALPVVTLPDGMQLAESIPQTTYFGKLHGYYPRDDLKAHKMELLIDRVVDCIDTIGRAYFQKKPNQMEEAIAKTVIFLDMIEPILAKSTFIMGDKLTVVDFWVASHLYCDKANEPLNPAYDLWKPVLAKYPNFKRYGEAYKKENAAWLMKRPKREF